MIAHLADKYGHIYGVDEREPVCGEDACDDCGDCLVCYANGGCPHTDWGPHRWVVYDDEKQG